MFHRHAPQRKVNAMNDFTKAEYQSILSKLKKKVKENPCNQYLKDALLIVKRGGFAYLSCRPEMVSTLRKIVKE